MPGIVLACSSGAQASVAIPWLADRYHGDIVTVTCDFGQGRALEDARDRALALGAVRAHVLAVRDEFAREFILPALRAHAIDDAGHPMAALRRPLIARKLIEIARIEDATIVAHLCAGPGTDPGPLEAAIGALDARLEIVAIPVAVREDRVDRVVEGPDEPAHVDLAFDRGQPTSVNGVAMPLPELMDSLTTIAGAHARAETVLYTAHEELRRLVTTCDLERAFALVSLEYAGLVRSGQWFTPLRAALDGFVEHVEARVTGVVRLRLFEEECRLVGATSPFALDDYARAGQDAGDLFARLPADVWRRDSVWS